MRIQKRLAALAMTLLLCAGLTVAASAHDVPDLSRTGSISATMTCNGGAVGGGTLTLYKAGDVAEDNGDYSFTLTEDFAGSGVSLEDVEASGLADALAAWAAENSLTGTTAGIADDGTWTVSGLEPGLYLVVQETAADGFEAISPFLAGIPMYEDGVYVYDVDAQPKLGTLTEAEGETTGTTPGTSTTTTAASTDATLPQTGQLNWPVPVLAALGMCLFLAGWALHNGKQGKSCAA